MRQRHCVFLVPVLALLATPVFALNGPLDGLCTTNWIGDQYVLICAPNPGWNGDWVVYAHGYVAPQEELALPIDELTVNGQFLPELVLSLGYGFATTSYTKNGFAIEQAVTDINALVNVLRPPSLDQGLCRRSLRRRSRHDDAGRTTSRKVRRRSFDVRAGRRVSLPDPICW